MKPKTVTAEELAALTRYSPSTVSTWVKRGLLSRNAAGKLDLAASLSAIKQHEAQRLHEGQRVGETGELGALRQELLRKRIAKLDFELNVARGKVHDKAACCDSLQVIREAEKHALYALAPRVASKFGELAPQIEREINVGIHEILGRLHSGEPYQTTKKSRLEK
jgi:phage terminase Nu1 subunit (DNA packaging protein)